jgi:tetratricopeptide (TPR) repeat protein
MRMRPFPIVPGAVLAGLLLLSACWATRPRADGLEPDPAYREAQLDLRLAVRDTVGQPLTLARLDSLAVAHLRLGNLDDAKRLFERALVLSADDETALAGLGKIVLFRGDPARAESLLARVSGRLPGATEDLYAARLRLGRGAEDEALAAAVGQAGQIALLRRLAEGGEPWKITGPDQVEVPWSRSWPVPLVKAKLNGQIVLLAIDTGVTDLLLDPSAARRCKVVLPPEQRSVFWSGTRVAARNAVVQRLELSGLRIERIPAAMTSLRRWSLEVNPQGEAVAGIIGLDLLARFTPTLDYRKCVLVLRRPGPGGQARPTFTPGPDALRVPFEMWSEGEMTVYASLNGGRRMALMLATGVPGCGVGAPQEVFEEVGVRPGPASRAIQSAGSYLQGQSWARVQVGTVTVGPVVKDKVHGWSGAFSPGELWRHGVRRDGLLGGDFLRGQRVTIDWEKRELVFE